MAEDLQRRPTKRAGKVWRVRLTGSTDLTIRTELWLRPVRQRRSRRRSRVSAFGLLSALAQLGVVGAMLSVAIAAPLLSY